MDLLAMPDVDEEALRSKQKEILAGQQRMQNLVIDHLLEDKEILTAEQTEKLLQLLRDQCRPKDGISPRKGFGRVLKEDSCDSVGKI